MVLTKTIHFIYLKCFLSLIYWANAGNCASNRTLGERCTHVLCRENVVSLTAISSDRWFHRTKDPIAHIFSVLWFGKVMLRDSKTKSFPSICYDRQEEVVVVTASFVTRKTYLGNLGWSFSTTYPEQILRLENISSVQGNIILCEKLKTNLCGKLRNNNRCKIVSLSHAFATKYYLCWWNSCSSKRLVPKLFFPVPGTIALALNMDIGQGSGSRYTFEKHYFNQQHVRLNLRRLFVRHFQKIIINFHWARFQIFYP